MYKSKAAEEALPEIFNAYYREGKMIIKPELEAANPSSSSFCLSIL
ncbi:MAG: hypothetical protein WA667_16030 [Candidatus Nitrosopolaris sp.]